MSAKLILIARGRNELCKMVPSRWQATSLFVVFEVVVNFVVNDVIIVVIARRFPFPIGGCHRRRRCCYGSDVIGDGCGARLFALELVRRHVTVAALAGGTSTVSGLEEVDADRRLAAPQRTRDGRVDDQLPADARRKHAGPPIDGLLESRAVREPTSGPTSTSGGVLEVVTEDDAAAMRTVSGR
jgi:hypothetical protein